MIQANELRIGNYINVKEGSGIRRSGTWRIVNHRTISDIASRGNNDYESIILTKDWLLKFGLSETDSIVYNYGLETGFSIECSLGKLFLYPDEGTIKLEHIKYVHQLQNLYFALTGEELKIEK